MTAKEKAQAKARALGLSDEGTTAEIKARIEAHEASASDADENPDSPAEAAAGAPSEATGDDGGGDFNPPAARRGGGAKPAPKPRKGTGSKRYRCLSNVSVGSRTHDIGAIVTLTEAQAEPIRAHLEEA